MQSPITERQYAFGDAVLAAGVSPAALRNWLDRGQIPELDAEAEERAGARWRRFSLLDVLRLAMVRRVVDYGAPVAFAGLAAGGWLASAALLLAYTRTPVAALAAHYRHRIAVVWRPDAGGWDARMIASTDDLPGGIADAWVTIDLGTVAESVMTTLAALYGTEEST
jgi:hypothetical protein